MAKITNVVLTAELGCNLDLKQVTNSANFIRYNPKLFSGVIWSHRKIQATCLLFRNGKMVCTGAKSISIGRKSVRQYGRMIQKLGYDVSLKKIRVQTISAVHTLQASIKPESLVEYLGAVYEPEIFSAARLRKEGIHYSCFHTGKVIITGIKSMNDLEEKVSETMLELECLTNSI